MVIRISSALHDALLAEAANDPLNEVCGLLFGDERIQVMSPTANVAADPSRTFEIDPGALFAAIRAERAGGARLLGYYHSHPTGDCRPSDADAAQAAVDGRVWIIIGNGQLAAWRLTKNRLFESVGIQAI